VGVYYRKNRKLGRRIWWLSYTFAGRQVFESSHSTSKRFAQKLLAIRLAEIAEGRWNLPASNPPRFKLWAERFLRSIQNANTKARYSFSVAHLLEFFGENTRLSDVASVRRIEEFKQERLETGVKPATVNRDLSVLRRMLTLAARQRLIARNPFSEIELLEERKSRRQPHILSYEEQTKILAQATPHLRALIVLITETGLRVNKEALRLKWTDFDFQNSFVIVRDSKSEAGRRSVPLSGLCTAEMLLWRSLVEGFSAFVFPNMKCPSKPLGCILKTWSTALKNAKIPQFPIYNLRHTFASRLAAAGASPITVAQLLGHSSTGIVMTYAKTIDEARRDAINKLEQFRESRLVRSGVAEQIPAVRPN
jgi:integrase